MHSLSGGGGAGALPGRQEGAIVGPQSLRSLLQEKTSSLTPICWSGSLLLQREYPMQLHSWLNWARFSTVHGAPGNPVVCMLT